MSDAPTAATIEARAFRATSLSQSDLQTISDLIQQLKENSYLYESHVRLINLLHQGLVSHICPPETPDALGNPLQYPLLRDLRQAREAMDSRFPVGEDLWMDWLEDECMLASTVEDRVAVMELCQKAVQDEVGSSRLWRLYGDWMWFLYKSSAPSTVISYEHNTLEQHSIIGMILANQTWTEEDELVGREVFSWDAMMNVWVQGARAASWHINSSHLVWQPYLEILTNDLYRNATQEKIQHVGQLLNQRLRQPQPFWDEVFQIFSHYVTKYGNASYEEIMSNTIRDAAASKHDYTLRQEFETRLLTAAQAGDKNAEWTTFTEYFEWEAAQSKEVKQRKKRNTPKPAFELRIALQERANLRFPNDTEFWEGHIDLAQDNTSYTFALLDIAERATRHCPWSGNLWSRRLSVLEAANKEFSQLEEVKHHATSTGLLEELGGIDEIIRVHTSWCGFLRRRAFAPNSGEEELDVAEVGILSAIEDIRAIGEKKFGADFKGDPQFRVEKIFVNFLSQAKRQDEARQFWNKLAVTHGDFYEFWDRFYMWEMVSWGRQGGMNGRGASVPELATAVLRSAVNRPNLDWPEKMIDAYLHHCTQFETIPKLQEAQIEARRLTKLVLKRRAKEAEDALVASNVAVAAQPSVITSSEASAADHDDVFGTGKRKREGESHHDEETSPKRVREDHQENQATGFPDISSSAMSQIKRDRENTTVVVKHLPSDVTETKIRQFFRDVSSPLLECKALETDFCTVRKDYQYQHCGG